MAYPYDELNFPSGFGPDYPYADFPTQYLPQPPPGQAPAPAQAPQPAPSPQQAPASSPQPFQREQFRDAWLATGSNKAAQDALLAQYGLQLDPAGRATLPTGETLDLRIGAKAGGTQAAWTGVGTGLKTGQAPSVLTPQTFGAAPTPAQPDLLRVTDQPIGTPPGTPSVDPTTRNALLALLQRSQPGNIDVQTDPNLSPQARAYQAARTRAARQQRAQAAERAAFTGENLGGQGSGAFETTLGGIQESAGRDIAGFEAGLVGQEIQARRQDLLNGLQLASAIGARDQEAAIRTQLAQMDEAYRRAALAQQRELGFGELGLRGQQLAQQQAQFEDQFGLNRAQFEADQNRLALLLALGG